MPVSINGWPVLEGGFGDPRLKRLPIPGCPARSLTMRAEVLPLFLALAADYHCEIAPLDQGAWDEWSFDYRQARAASSWSDHASGTAVDLNASAEGRLGTGPMAWWRSADRYLKAQELKRRYEVAMWGGAKELGGDYYLGSTTDWMHWAIRPGVSVAQVQAVIAKLGIQPDGTRAGATPPKASARERELQRRLDRTRAEAQRRRQAGERTAGLPSMIARLKERIARVRGQ